MIDPEQVRVVKTVLAQCMRFLMHPFYIYGFYFSLWNVTMLIAAFHVTINTICRILGKTEVFIDE